MRIVIVGPAFPLRGGIAHFASLLYKHLTPHHEVRVVTFSRQYPKIFFPGVSQEEGSAEGVEIPTERLIDSMNPVTWVTAAKSIAEWKPDLVIVKYWLPALGPCLGTIARLVRRRSSAKITFICHNVLPHERRPGDTLFTRYALRSADFFVALSKVVARDLLTVHPQASVTVVPHPVYESFGAPIRKSVARKALGIRESRVLLFFGHVRSYKGLKTLLAALPIVLERIPVHLYVVGEFYEDIGAYEKHIRELNLGAAVTIVPRYVTRDEVAAYFSACDVVVLPYWSATQSGIIQIAHQFERPVIATDVGAIGEVLEDGTTGLLVPPRDEARLADAITRFFSKKMGERMSRQMKRAKNRFSWESLVQAIEEQLLPTAPPMRRRRRGK